MNIQLSDNVIFQAALVKVNEGEYFDALCLFARVEGYESMLNQIGCLCALRDIGYANELYRNLLAGFYFTHNCYADIRKLGDSAENVTSYFYNDKANPDPDPNKISADEDLLGFYPIEYDDLFDFDDVDLIHDALELEVTEARRKSTFYDVKTPNFYRNLFQRMERAYFGGNLHEGKELQRQFLDIDTDDAETLELQLFLCFTQQLWDRGVPFALRYARLANVTTRGIGMSAEILCRASEPHTDIVEQLFNLLAECADELADRVLMEYIQLASTHLGYGEVTLKLTQILYTRYKYAGCSALLLCARTFFNCGDSVSARDAILTLLRAAPWDGVASAYLIYFNHNVKVALDNVAITNSIVRHFDVPHQLSVIAQYLLLKDMDENKLVLDNTSYPLIKCMFKLCLGCIIKGDADSFYSEAQALSTVLTSFTPANAQDFWVVAKQCMASVFTEPALNKDFLRILIQQGCKDNIYVSTNRGCYALDLSQLRVFDNAFVAALSICASLRKVGVRTLERAYKQLQQVVGGQFDSDNDTVRQLAYALLAIGYKHFAESDESAYFSDDEHALYQQYMEKL